MEIGIIVYKKNEFTLYQIIQLVNSDFDKKSQKYHDLSKTSPI